MKKKNRYRLSKLIVLAMFAVTLMALQPGPLAAKNGKEKGTYAEIGTEVQRLMDEGDIPGLSLVIINGEEEQYLKGYGYADLEKEQSVTQETLFELASCSKAFTGLAALISREQGLIRLDDPVSKYYPGFHGIFEEKKYEITIRQLLHQTSGIPFSSISLIPPATHEKALQEIVQKLDGIELNRKPGKSFEYATINYDVVGAVIEKVSGTRFENYIKEHILRPLEMNDSIVGVDKKNPPPNKSRGYKIGFMAPRQYDAPVYRGNNPAGYVQSNGKDMLKWMKMQMGLDQHPLAALAQETHRGDRTVPIDRGLMASYAMGWFQYIDRLKRVDHAGGNPNFTIFMVFNPVDKIGVAVMANSNSDYTRYIADTVFSKLSGRGFSSGALPDNNMDKGSSVVTVMLIFFLLCLAVYIVLIILDLFKGRRKFEGITIGKLAKALLVMATFVPFIVGIYLIPRTMAGISMETAIVFSPISFYTVIQLILATMTVGYVTVVLSLFFPQQNEYLRTLPLIIVLSLLAGGSNAVVIFLVTTSIFSEVPLFYQLYNFALAFFVYIIGRKIVQTKLIRITFNIVYDMRMKLMEKISYTSYQSFEQVDRGRVLATLNNDTNQIGNSANILVQLVSSAVTTLGAFIYLATIAFWATAITMTTIGFIAALYLFVTMRTQVFFEEARDTQNSFMELINGLVDGFKELSLHFNKRMEYKDEVGRVCDEFRMKISKALIRFVNAFLVGESLLLIILGTVGYGIPRLFPDITPLTLMAFIMVLLYLIGPINAILNAMPAISQLRVAWNRVQEFTDDIPANMDPQEMKEIVKLKPQPVGQMKTTGLYFEYEGENEDETFSVGPIDFETGKGEIVFIIGGNGSGKTTLAKLLTGLYLPQKGTISLEGEPVNNYRLGEYYSTVFSNFHLFEKLYDTQLEGREEEIQKYLKMLKLEEKVFLEDGAFSTIELSGGQRKRLALLKCYLEDRPIYLFDEIAADQDPGFRKFFYRNLLKKMKDEGKIVIAITHDDHYFDVADKIIKLDMGKIETVNADYRTTAATQIH
ncbi:MAG: cyclic peptide export ABC transporter [bacterium]|nr:cyclic peptide export ABC transporter [bacterium]